MNNTISVYLPAVMKLEELQKMSAEVASAGLAAVPTHVGGSLSAWLDGLPCGTTAWVRSLALFGSITELMARNETLAARGVALRSIAEPWFNDPSVSSSQTLVELFRLGAQLHAAPLPPPAKRKAHTASKSDPARVEKAVRLRTEQRLSVARACQLAGCSVVAYYQHLKKQNP